MVKFAFVNYYGAVGLTNASSRISTIAISTEQLPHPNKFPLLPLCS